MRKYVTQMFEEINADPDKLALYKDDAAVRIILTHAFVPEKKFILPEGEPPFKPASEPLGMTPTNLFSELRRMYVFCRQDLTPFKRESLFISFLEGIHPTEAAMMIAVKDQELHKVYPKITRKLLEKHGLLTPKEKKEQKSA